MRCEFSGSAALVAKTLVCLRRRWDVKVGGASLRKGRWQSETFRLVSLAAARINRDATKATAGVVLAAMDPTHTPRTSTRAIQRPT